MKRFIAAVFHRELRRLVFSDTKITEVPVIPAQAEIQNAALNFR